MKVRGVPDMSEVPSFIPRPALETDARISREISLFGKLMRGCLRSARAHLRAGNLDLALGWTHWAALLFCDQRCGVLVCPELEQTLARLARRLPRPQRATPRRPGPRRWLHVFTHWEPTGGHSALARRWMEMDPEREIHSLVLMEQAAPLPENVWTTTQATGGQVYVLDAELTLSQRAARLRSLAWENYDVISLHLHQFDAVSVAAFAVPGGPPVVFVNGADHMFWVGASVGDLVLNIRPLAEEWSRKYRGIPRGQVLPIPLPTPEPITPAQRAEARRELGIAPERCVLLSIGSEWKFSPLPGLDFTHIAEKILSACPTAQLVVVGPDPEAPRWREARQRCEGRLTVYAARPHLQPFHRAADLYLDPLPHGSLTALLEVAALGIPCVLQPRSCPYPLYPEDGALAVLDRPADVTAYVQRVKALVEDAEERNRQAQALARSVHAHHCGAGWQDHLRTALRALPPRHRVYPVEPPAPPPVSYVRFWHDFLGALDMSEFLRYALGHPLRSGLGLRLDAGLWKAVMRECLELPPEKGLRVLESVLSLSSLERESGLYVDPGNGYSEAHRLKTGAVLGDKAFCVTFDLSAYPCIRSARWDPVEGCFCKVRLKSVSYQIASGEKGQLDLGTVTSNGTLMPDGVHLFATNDPMFFLPLSGAIASVTIRGEWWGPFGPNEIQVKPLTERKLSNPFIDLLKKSPPAALLRRVRRLLKKPA